MEIFWQPSFLMAPKNKRAGVRSIAIWLPFLHTSGALRRLNFMVGSSSSTYTFILHIMNPGIMTTMMRKIREL